MDPKKELYEILKKCLKDPTCAFVPTSAKSPPYAAGFFLVADTWLMCADEDGDFVGVINPLDVERSPHFFPKILWLDGELVDLLSEREETLKRGTEEEQRNSLVTDLLRLYKEK